MGEYCPSCMAENADNALVCEVCGGDMNLKNRQHQLPVMTILDGRYLIGKVLGEGGFGITYIGLDLRINEKVAIKEFYPAGNVTRYSEHSMRVEATSADAEVLLKREGEKFLTEAQTMSRLNKVPNIVHVRDFFQANETSYIVMEYIDGETLASKLKKEGPQKEFNKLYALLKPMMKSLDEVHKSGLIHRDISPSNLMLDKDGEVKLLDFGTAREVNTDGEKSLSVVLKPGFAPEEQYRRRGKQGPWTDVYALCATIYKLCTGITPEISVDRLSEDTLVPPSKLGVKINKSQESALIRGLAVRQTDRIQTVGELIEEFDKTESVLQKISIKPAEAHQNQPEMEKTSTKLNSEIVPRKAVDHEINDKHKTQKAEPRNDSNAERKTEKRPKRAFAILLPAICAVIAIALVIIKVIIPNNKYSAAVALMNEGNIVEAYESLIALDGYKDSEEKAASIYDRYKMLVEMLVADVGSYVTFGAYEQDNDPSNGKEPIEWQVLAKEGDKILVISKYALDAHFYNPLNTENEDVTWETCNLRAWLNGTFLDEAFSEAEQSMIQTTEVSADKNPDYSTDPGNTTKDKIFLLSINEAKKYFASDEARMCVPTAYAIANGAGTDDRYKLDGEATCWWWLRSPGRNQDFAANVRSSGGVDAYGDYINGGNYGVRPALWINLDVASDEETETDNNQDSTPNTTQSDYAAADVGDIIEFGAYEQDNDTSNGKESIEWQVLAKEDNRILVISKYALDAQPYIPEWEDVTWETCTLRTWMNGTFLKEAFSEAEQRIIQTTAVSADKNPNYSTNPGNATKDKIFLLSINEANKYFASNEVRMCVPTAYAAYAIANGAYTNEDYKVDGEATCWWWLRSPGEYQDGAVFVDYGGIVYSAGCDVDFDCVCVRPALWISLDVSSDTGSENNFAGNILSDYAAADVGDIIEFGAYEQDNDTSNGKESIEWQVLAKEDNKLLVISKYALDSRPFNTVNSDVNWENCSLRNWLNGTFFDEAFTAAEQGIVQSTEVTADKNPDYTTNLGNTTVDKIFLLSINDVNKYLTYGTTYVMKWCAPTVYAIANGAWTSSNCKLDDVATCRWWLRSIGETQYRAAYIDDDGDVLSNGELVSYTNVCVRPAMWINLDDNSTTGGN